MTPRDDQYERIARYLDGDPTGLSEDDRQFLAEFRRLDGFASARLDEPMPMSAMRRATNRLRAAALWRRRWRHGGRALAVGASLATAAAAVVIAVSMLWQPALPPGSTYSPRPETAYVPTDVMIDSLDWSTDLSTEMALIEQELEMVEQKVASWPGLDLDDGLKAVERDVDDFFDDDTQDDSLERLLLGDETAG